MLKVKNLTVLHPTGQELNEINISVGRGEVVGVIGQNDSGKSLLAHVIADPTIDHRGEISINHLSRSENLSAISQIGYSSSNHQLSNYLTGYEQLDFWAGLFEMSAATRSKQIIHTATLFNFTSSLYSLIETMTTDQKQIVSLIGSLVHQPSVVIWDNPTAYLDPIQKTHLVSVVKELVDEKTSLLIASNDLEFIERVATEIIIMSNGSVIESGNLKQLKNIVNSSTLSLEEILQLALQKHEQY